MELFYLIFVIFCEAALPDSSSSYAAAQSLTTSDSSSPTTSDPSVMNSQDVQDLFRQRLERSRMHRLQSLRQHVLDSLGWEEPPDIDPETKRRLLSEMPTPMFVTRHKTCYYAACNLPYISMPDYINRTIWFDTSSSNIRLYFNLQHDQDPNLTITSAVIKLHLKSREDCPCAYEESDPTTTRIHIKIYQYRKPIRSVARLRHNNRRLIDAKMVTWEGSRWVTLQVTEAVKRVITRGRRNGGFEVHIKDMDENILNAKQIIDPTICSSINNYNCLEPETHDSTIDDLDEPYDPNYSPLLEITSTTRNIIDIGR